MHLTPRRILNWTGTCIAIASIVFVSIKLYDYRAQLDISRFGAETWITFFALALVYAAANGLLMVAWRYLQCEFSRQITLSEALHIFGISQLAKYVPGNIFHLAGRQALGMAAGLPAWTLIKAAFWELALISISGGLYGLLVIPLLLHSLRPGVETAGFIFAVVLVSVVLTRYLGIRFGKAFCLYVGFLTISSGIFIGAIALITDPSASGLHRPALLMGAYVVAWLAGLVTPGAPAGIGIRELILLKLLSDQIDQSDLLVTIMIGRAITVLGDIAFFIFTLLYSSSRRNT